MKAFLAALAWTVRQSWYDAPCNPWGNGSPGALLRHQADITAALQRSAATVLRTAQGQAECPRPPQSRR